MPILSDTELNTALTEIDLKLRGENINIAARPLCALSELSTKVNAAIEVPGELSSRIFSWFDRLYGERLQMGLSLGVTAITIGGDPYRVRLPLMFGTTAYVMDTGPLTRTSMLSGQEVTFTNISQFVEGLTAERVKSMTVDECNEIVLWFANSIVAGSDIDSVAYPEFVSEAKADLASSVDLLLSRPPQFGLSRWASLQAIEKFLKAFIRERGGRVQRIHVLDELANAAESLGIRSIDRVALTAAQCSAGVRYGAEASTQSQALAAHRAATQICGAIASEFRSRKEWRTGRYDGASRDGLKRMVLLLRGTQAEIAKAQSQP